MSGEVPPPNTEAIIEQLERHAPELFEAAGVEGASIAVLEGGEIAWELSWGIANADTGAPVTVDTTFNVGSISKPVAAWTAMALVEDRLLELDRPVGDDLRQWRPPDDPRWQQITPRLLLSHTSSLSFGRGGGLIGYDEGEALPTLVQVLDGTAPAKNPAVELGGEPRSAYAYSAAGYALIQALIEDASGEPYAELARARTFAPLAMDRSSFEPEPADGDAARGHNMYGQPYARLEFTAESVGGLYTTARDLARLLAAVSDVGPLAQGGGALAPESVAELRAAQPPGMRGDFGLGFVRKRVEIDGVHYEIISAVGKNRGYYAAVHVFPETADGVIVLTNSDRAVAPLHRLTCAYLRWRIQGGVCTGPPSTRPQWTATLVMLALVLVCHGVWLAIALRRHQRTFARPPNSLRALWRPVLGLVLALMWLVTLYTPVVASLALGAHDEIPYPHLGADVHWLTAMVLLCCAWFGATAWFRRRDEF